MPTPEDLPTVETPDKPNRATRRAQAKIVRATLKSLTAKKPMERDVPVVIDGQQSTILFRAIGAKEWEALTALHPPTKAQKEENAAFNADTFPAALLAAVCVDPPITEDDWLEIWTSDSWSRGELADLFNAAWSLCTNGFDIPFSASA